MGSPGKWFKLFIKDEQRREKIFNKYVHWKAIYNLGESEIGFLKSFIGFQSVAVYYLVAEQWAKKVGVEISMENIGVIIPCWLVFKLVLYLSIGIFWDKNKFIQYTQEWSNKRNPTVQEIRRNVATQTPVKQQEKEPDSQSKKYVKCIEVQCFKCREWTELYWKDHDEKCFCYKCGESKT